MNKIKIQIYTKNGFQIAKSYIRVVYGERGPYIEISKEQIIYDNLYIPQNKLWKVYNQDIIDYIEYRTLKDNVKIYFQIKPVDYADYKVNYFYVSLKEVSKIKKNILEWVEN